MKTMSEIRNILLKMFIAVVHFSDVTGEPVRPLDIYSASELIPVLYNIYMEAVTKDLDIMTRRVLQDQKQYTIHIEKLKDVNGIKSHNLLVSEDTFQRNEPIVYINNPVESHLPYTYLTEDQFKRDMLKTITEQREEFQKEKLMKYVKKLIPINRNIKRVGAVMKQTVKPIVNVVLKQLDISKTSEHKPTGNKHITNKNNASHKTQKTTTKAIVTDAENESSDDRNSDGDRSTVNTINTNDIFVIDFSGDLITVESNLTEVTSKTEVVQPIAVRTYINNATTINLAPVLTTAYTEEFSTVNTQPEETTMAFTTTTGVITKLTHRTKQGRPYVFIGQ